MNVLEEFEALTKTTPQIAKVNPAAKPEMEAFYRAGGIPRVMQHLGGLLDTSVMTVSGKTLAEIWPATSTSIRRIPPSSRRWRSPSPRPAAWPFCTATSAPVPPCPSPAPSIPPCTALWVRPSATTARRRPREAILGGKIQAGDVVVIRYEGPRAAPGMREDVQGHRVYVRRGPEQESAALITRRPVLRHQQRMLRGPYLPGGCRGRSSGHRSRRRRDPHRRG